MPVGWLTRTPRSAWIAAVLLAAPVVAAPPRNPSHAARRSPVIELQTHSGDTLSGKVVAFGSTGLLLQQEGGSQFVEWLQLPPESIYRGYRRLMDDRDATQWLELSSLLRNVPQAQTLADTTRRIALAIDPRLSNNAPPLPPTLAGMYDGGTLLGQTAPARIPWGHSAFTWPDPFGKSDDLLIAEARAAAEEVAATLGLELREVETRHFLYFTALAPQRTFDPPRLLDQMYAKACELYGIPRGTRLFPGKCSVFLFESQEQFRRYVAAFGGPADAAGFCQQSTTGGVRIVLWQSADRAHALQTMLHETAHGVNWRYRAPMFLPAWLEEGIAEWVASETTGNYRYVRARKQAGVQRLRQTGRLGESFLDADARISEPWQYGVSYTMVEMLIRQDRAKFVRFVDAIKSGDPWEAALRSTYGYTTEEFLLRLGRALDVKDLQR